MTLLGAIGSGMMPAPKSGGGRRWIGGERGTHAVELHFGRLRLRRGDEDEQTEAEHEGEAEQTEACRATYRDA